ncbi:MAG: T9SS type A sorting domain-containing protein [Paludibacter sp.]|nr:T9SS type A sorting domain-containing protein [Paludibacter sp.]
MKKNYKKMLSVLCLGLIGMSAYAQGTWKALGTEAAITAGTNIETGIFNLTVAHSDGGAAAVIGKSDVGAPHFDCNGITWDNEAIIQGGTNGMYFALKPASTGIIDVSIKMGSAKATFAVELADAFATDLTTLTTVTAPVAASTAYAASPIFLNAANYTTPTVTETLSDGTVTTGTWNGTVAINTSGANQWLAMSFPVTANKIYVVGCFGSKLMLRGINYSLTSAVNQVLSNKGISFNGKEVTNTNNLPIEIYNVLGKKVAASSTTISTANLQKGIYIVKAVGLAGTFKFSL